MATTTETSTVPPDFLHHPAPDIKVSRIDFTTVNLPVYRGRYAVVLDDVLTPAECETLIAAAEASTTNGWERAMVNVGGGRQAMLTDTRNCGRIIWDSRDVVGRIWQRIAHLPDVQEIVTLKDVPHIFGNGPAKWNETWKFTRPNERMRFLKYTGGEYFRPHCDGSYETPDRSERSYVTMHLYLNTADVVSKEEVAQIGPSNTESVLVGGATTFHSYNMKKKYDVLPKAGRILLFQHRDLLHSGDDVVSGTKYTMRTDLMYSVVESGRRKADEPLVLPDYKDKAGEGTDGVKEADWYGYLG